MLKSAPPDLVITDLVMPDIEGLELIQTLVQSYPGLKIIATSGAFKGEFLKMAQAFGVKATLPKPFTPNQLLTLVGQVAGIA